MKRFVDHNAMVQTLHRLENTIQSCSILVFHRIQKNNLFTSFHLKVGWFMPCTPRMFK